MHLLISPVLGHQQLSRGLLGLSIYAEIPEVYKN